MEAGTALDLGSLRIELERHRVSWRAFNRMSRSLRDTESLRQQLVRENPAPRLSLLIGAREFEGSTSKR